MLFGSKATFGIEAIAEPALSPPSAVWGRMRIWCQGTSIGDFSEEYCALYPSYLGLKTLRQSLPTLWLPEFTDMPETALWNFCDGALYGFHRDTALDDRRTLEEMQQDSAHYGRFNFLTNWGEQFDDGGKSFIFCKPDGRVQILNRSFSGALAREVSLTDTAAAIDAFMAWFEAEAERLQGAAMPNQKLQPTPSGAAERNR